MSRKVRHQPAASEEKSETVLPFGPTEDLYLTSHSISGSQILSPIVILTSNIRAPTPRLHSRCRRRIIGTPCDSPSYWPKTDMLAVSSDPAATTSKPRSDVSPPAHSIYAICGFSLLQCEVPPLAQLSKFTRSHMHSATISSQRLILLFLSRDPGRMAHGRRILSKGHCIPPRVPFPAPGGGGALSLVAGCCKTRDAHRWPLRRRQTQRPFSRISGSIVHAVTW